MKEFNTRIKSYRATFDGGVYWEYEIYDAENYQTVFGKGGFETYDEAKESLDIALDNLKHPERLKWKINEDGTAKRLSAEGNDVELIVRYAVTCRRKYSNFNDDSDWGVFDTKQQALDWIHDFVAARNKSD